MANDKDFKVKNGIQPTVYHEAVGTVVSESPNYNIAQAVLENTSPNVNAQEANPHDVAISSDGTKMYIVGNGSDSVLQYTMSTAFDVSTASYDSVSILVRPQCDNPLGLTFSTDGSNFYVTGITDANVAQYSLSTPWSLASATYSGNSFDISTQEDAPRAVIFSSDGFKMYVCGSGSDAIHQYNLTTAWDVSSASYSNNSLDTSSQDINPQGLALSGDGTKLFMAGNVSDAIYQYNLSTANDLSTATYSNINFSVASLTFPPQGLAFSSDGSNMYVVVSGTVDTVSQYSTALTTASLDLSTGSVFDYTPTSDVQVTLTNPAASGTSSGATLLLDGAGTTGYDLGNASYDSVSFSVASQDIAPSGLAFNNDGSKMYMAGNLNDSIYQYSLSTAFDLSTASYDSVSFIVASQDATPRGIVFNTDGTKIYMVGTGSDSIYQYSLSTAFDLSTASYGSVSFSVTSQDGNPLDIAFNNDGSKMYMLGFNNKSIYQYSLSTAFDLSTALYGSVSFSVTSQDTAPYDITFNNDGTKMYMLGSTGGSIYQYSLSTAFDLSTASYDSISFSVASQDTAPTAVVFNSDGTKMYMVGFSIDSVHQYSTATPATITYDSALQWSGGTAPTSPAIGETDVLTFNTTDGGTTYQAVQSIDGAK